MSSTILLKNGTALVHDANGKPIATRCDILITGATITDIRDSIEVPSVSTEVIDCESCIISAGFIDTHHHLWQTALKGLHADHTLLEYFAPGNFTSSLYDPNDVYWGQLAGALEAIDAGTTTVVDHSHINYSPEHSRAAIKATVDSGLRCFYCYCATPRVKAWSPIFEIDQDFLPEWVIPTLLELASAPLAPQNRVALGFAFDGFPYLPPAAIRSLLQTVYDAGVRIVTAHANAGPTWGQNQQSLFEVLNDKGALALPHGPAGPTDDPMHFIGSHASYLEASSAVTTLFKDYYPTLNFSSTPTTEMTMSLTHPRAMEPELQPHGSIGVDCHSACSASIPGQMRLMLAQARSARDAKLAAKGRWPSEVGKGLGVEEAYNLGTVSGARTVGMEKQIGSLFVGGKADVVVISCDGPGMLGIGDGDELAGVVAHSGPADVAHVIIDGIFRKRSGHLVLDDVQTNGQKTTWEDVVKKVKASRMKIRKEVEHLDMHAATSQIATAFHLNMGAAVGSDGDLNH
ncbi:hypothetical protein FH972_021890 [Carpinus fangiana]|uniref:Amidohydrolase-related domain-containing protein n=1 Tax=Carpinus fangiana TaxID=176857 RepID=A0A5N6KR05_9ROSI|nr:hypothetical protein FH972_021890 [Carpinus fangiana]